MCLLFETIKVLDKQLHNIKFHSDRMNNARKELFDPAEDINLSSLLRVPSELDNGLYKCRIKYELEIKKIEWISYVPKEITQLKLVECNNIRYEYKYCDRSVFNNLLKENNCLETEDILILKDGMITDTSFSNIVFVNGREWHTPLYPLLKGTKRAELIQKSGLIEKQITRKDLMVYNEFKLINAMLDFSNSPSYPMKHILQ